VPLGTTATTITLVGRGVAVAEGSGLALWARATVRAVMRSISPASDRPTITYRLQRSAEVDRLRLVVPLVTDIPTHYFSGATTQPTSFGQRRAKARDPPIMHCELFNFLGSLAPNPTGVILSGVDLNGQPAVRTVRISGRLALHRSALRY